MNIKTKKIDSSEISTFYAFNVKEKKEEIASGTILLTKYTTDDAAIMVEEDINEITTMTAFDDSQYTYDIYATIKDFFGKAAEDIVFLSELHAVYDLAVSDVNQLSTILNKLIEKVNKKAIGDFNLAVLIEKEDIEYLDDINRKIIIPFDEDYIICFMYDYSIHYEFFDALCLCM